jgi:hypothetical protein
MTSVPLERPRGASEFLSDEEYRKRVQALEDLMKKTLEGKVEVAAERGLPLRNAAWYLQDDKMQVSRRRAQIIDPPNGRVPPWTPQQFKRWMEREEVKRGRHANQSWADRGPNERCLYRVDDAAVFYYGLIREPRNPVRITADEYQKAAGEEIAGLFDVGFGTEVSWQFVQAPGHVVIVEEGANQGTPSIIPLDGRPRPSNAIRTYLGVLRGRWEGDTLVVEVTNMNDQQDGGRYIPSQTTAVHPGSGETLRVIRRYTRLSQNALEVRTTVDDPEVYVQPWTRVEEWTLDNDYFVAPGQCQENNVGMDGILRAGLGDPEGFRRYADAEQQNRIRRIAEMKEEWKDWDPKR